MSFLSEIFKGTAGNFSSKRTITIGAFLLIVIAFLSNLFLGFDIKQALLDAALYITLFGIGATTAEPLALRNTKKDE